MKTITKAKAVRTRIEQFPPGTVFTSADFADITENSRVGVILARMEKEGIVNRVLQGVYYKPEYNRFLDEYLSVSPSLVANALARRFGWRIIPCGDAALNLLGLSTQIPAIWSYVSDGPYKTYSYGNKTITLKHTANKEISKLSFKTALTVQALKALGKDRVDDKIIRKLKKELTAKEKRDALAEAKNVTSWIYEALKQISEENSHD